MHERDLANAKLFPPGRRYSLGGNLFLNVTDNGSRSYVYRYQDNGKKREMGLGSIETVTLDEARDKVRDARRLREQDIDPIDHRRADQQAAKAAAIKGPQQTFRDVALAWIAANQDDWMPKYVKATTSSFERYAFPVLGALHCDLIDEALILKVLEPIWRTKHRTASDVRFRLQAVLGFAMQGGEATKRPNPAAWENLNRRLPSPGKVHVVKNHEAMPYEDVPAFFTALTSEPEREGAALEAEGTSRAIRFAILTATRVKETRLATAEEVDFDTGIWTIPAERMKGKKGKRRAHKVPLSDQAYDLIKDVREGYLFKGLREGPLSGDVMRLALQRRPGCDDLTMHGFRASFRTWVDEETTFDPYLAEEALAHTLQIEQDVGKGTYDGYARKNLGKRPERSLRFQRRRELMAAWADYCTGSGETSGNVLPFERKAG
jgi:integrase